MGIVRIRISNRNHSAVIDRRSRRNGTMGTMGIGEGSIHRNQAANPLFVNILRISPLPAICCGDQLISKLGKYRRINNLAASIKKSREIYIIPSRAFIRAVPLAHSARGRRRPVRSVASQSAISATSSRGIFNTVNFARAPFPSLVSQSLRELRGSRSLPSEGTTEATRKFAHLSRAMGQ
jgi:hypothetical protein